MPGYMNADGILGPGASSQYSVIHSESYVVAEPIEELLGFFSGCNAYGPWPQEAAKPPQVLSQPCARRASLLDTARRSMTRKNPR